jgi:multidrug efflux pump
VLEQTVAAPLENAINGVQGMLYMESHSTAQGVTAITVTFEIGTNVDDATINVNNRVKQVEPRLPLEVRRQGVSVERGSSSFLQVLAFYSPDERYNDLFTSNYVTLNVLDQVKRVPGTTNVQIFGAKDYAMRIWLQPDRLASLKLSPGDIIRAVNEQNAQFAAGKVGEPPTGGGQELVYTITTRGRLSEPKEFEEIILRSNPDGSRLRLGDVARVELASRDYSFLGRVNNRNATLIGVFLQPKANALDVGKEVDATMARLAERFPSGLKQEVVYDTTRFVEVSIREVMITLGEAMVLVFLVVFIFLQNWRATLIPFAAVPVSLLGTFGGLLALGYSINTLTLFGMVLAIGIVVDDAIVVIENVERIMTEEGLAPKEATRKAMGQITGAVVAITVVLAAVFIPSALQQGAAGIIYKQFALTIAVSMGFSAFLALSFTPALCATILKPTHHQKKNIVYRKFNAFFDWTTHTYAGHVGSAVRHAPRWMVVFVLVSVLCGFLFTRLPTSFVPDEDQGYALAIVQLPPGASLARTQKVMGEMRELLLKDPSVEGTFQISGFSFLGIGENVGMNFVRLKDWSKRDVTATEFITAMNQKMRAVTDAQIFVVNLPTIRGLSQFGGIDMYLQARAGQSRDELTEARNTLLQAAGKNQALVGVRPNTLEDAPLLQLSVDRTQAQTMGLSVSDIYSAIQLTLAPVYINDFQYAGRVKRVMVQADAPFRMGTDAFDHIFTPSSLTSAGATSMTTSVASASTSTDSSMIPLSSVVHSKWSTASPNLTRYNGYSAVEIVGNNAPGYSTGQAMNIVGGIVNDKLPTSYGYDWSGQSYQEVLAGNSATILMALSIVIVFLCLAALYESWSIPISVLLVVPLGLLGTIVFSMMRGLPNDIFFKIGMITVIGLAAKNAILIIEFAVEQQQSGMTLRNAIVEAARLRLRPIMMTSLAFILGVLPLAISTGAGANSRHAIGTGVIGGMLFATILGLLFIPVFYIVVRRMLGDKLDEVSHKLPHEGHGAEEDQVPDAATPPRH